MRSREARVARATDAGRGDAILLAGKLYRRSTP